MNGLFCMGTLHLQGQEGADELLGRLVNDHVAVANGDVLRLFTCGFVNFKPAQLLISLMGLLTLGAELEGIMGYSSFWAIYSLVVLTSATADAVFNADLITEGPGGAVAGMLGALLAHNVRNWSLEVQVSVHGGLRA